MATIVEQCKISPHHLHVPESEFSLPVLFWDMIWYNTANQSLLFFKFPCSKSHFIQVIIPNLKESLSLTLSQFLPLAGNIIHPLNENNNNKPIIRYVPGDSVCFKVCESNNHDDFDHLIGNHPRASDDFYAFAPNLHTFSNINYISCPALAIQVTLFPGHGICIGFVTHHAIVDARTVVCFMKAWSLINRSKTTTTSTTDRHDIKTQLVQVDCKPFYDRHNIVEINGLDSIYWEQHKVMKSTVEPPPKKFPINKVRSTFVLKREEIKMLKKHYVLAKRRSGVDHDIHLSTFTVACALVWICSAKSAALVVEDEETEYFIFMADCRTRLKPEPLPANYFGNCVSLLRAELKHGELKGNNGFVLATESIGEAIRERIYGEKGILYGAEDWPEEYWNKLAGKRQYGVAGSPKFDFYAVDYGWGRPKKFEGLFLDDGDGFILITNSQEFEGGLEIGLSKPKDQMKTFTAVFKHVLHQHLFISC